MTRQHKICAYPPCCLELPPSRRKYCSDAHSRDDWAAIKRKRRTARKVREDCLETENERLKAEAIELRELHRIGSEANQELRESSSRWSEELNKANQSIKELTADKQSLELLLEEKEAQIARVEHLNEQVRIERDEANNSLQAREDHQDKQQKTIEGLRAHAADRDKAYGKAMNNASRLEKELAKAAQELQDMTAERDEAFSEEADAKLQVQDLEKQVKILEGSREDLSARLGDSEKQVSDLRQTRNRLEQSCRRWFWLGAPTFLVLGIGLGIWMWTW